MSEGREARLRRVSVRFRAATPRRYRRRTRLSVGGLSVPTLLFGVMIGGIVGAILTWPEPSTSGPAMREMSASETVRHMLASRNCAAARSVGLAPADMGEPGYWPSHDADNDGVACEPAPVRLGG